MAADLSFPPGTPQTRCGACLCGASERSQNPKRSLRCYRTGQIWCFTCEIIRGCVFSLRTSKISPFTESMDWFGCASFALDTRRNEARPLPCRNRVAIRGDAKIQAAGNLGTFRAKSTSSPPVARTSRPATPRSRDRIIRPVRHGALANVCGAKLRLGHHG